MSCRTDHDEPATGGCGKSRMAREDVDGFSAARGNTRSPHATFLSLRRQRRQTCVLGSLRKINCFSFFRFFFSSVALLNSRPSAAQDSKTCTYHSVPGHVPTFGTPVLSRSPRSTPRLPKPIRLRQRRSLHFFFLCFLSLRGTPAPRLLSGQLCRRLE